MEQILINATIGAVMALFGFFMRAAWQSIKDLQAESRAVVADLNEVKVLVVGNYVTKADLDRKMDAMFEKLDRIEAKLDRKADKQ